MRLATPSLPCLLAAALLASPGAVRADLEPDVAAAGPRPCAILLHGLGRTWRAMEPLAEALDAAGFVAANVDYASRAQPIEELANVAVAEGVQRCRDAGATPIHFVTHSMGGLLVRYYLSTRTLPDLARVVMLAPPNQGSEVADALREKEWFRRLNGPAGAQLGTGPDGIAASLGPVAYPVGVIAGSEVAFYDGWLAGQIPGDNDGKVSVQRTQVEGMSDFRVLPVTHTFIVSDDEAIAQTLSFLREGRFLPLAVEGDPQPP
jgi:pimeloyl-ACP methyl ester carboxylesterase